MDDPRCPLAGVKWAADRAARVYAAIKAPPITWMNCPDVGHEMTPAMDQLALDYVKLCLLELGAVGGDWGAGNCTAFFKK